MPKPDVGVSLSASRAVTQVPPPYSDKAPAKVTLTGRVSGLAQPNTLQVRLISQVPDYGLKARGRTDVARDGSFEFAVRPSANTRYRAVVSKNSPAKGSSRPVEIIVVTRLSLSVSATGKRKVAFNVTSPEPGTVSVENGDGTSDIAADRSRNGKAHVYAVRGSKARRVASVKMKNAPTCSSGCSVEGAREARLAGQVKRAKGFLACLPRPVWVGFGVRDRACGRRTLRLH